MSDERIIELLQQAANRGRPRGAEAVWEGATTTSYAPSRTKPRRARGFRAVLVVVAVVVAGTGAGLVASRGRDGMAVSGTRFASPVDLPDGWTTGKVATPQRPTAPQRSSLTVLRRDNDVLVVQGFTGGDHGLVWTVAEADDARTVTVGGLRTRLSLGGNVNDLDMATIERGDQRARVLGRGVTESELLTVAAAVIDGSPTTPEGFEVSYSGTEASGVLGAPSTAVASVPVTSPSGREMRVLSSEAPFVIESTDWIVAESTVVDVDGRRVLLAEFDGEARAMFDMEGVSVMVGGTGATREDVLVLARSVDLAVAEDDEASALTTMYLG